MQTTWTGSQTKRSQTKRTGWLVTALLCATALTGGAAMLPLPAASADDDTLTMTEFRALHEQLRAIPDKPWRTIPWKTSVLDAQQAAAKARKPIFIWAMDGHPLGCT